MKPVKSRSDKILLSIFLLSLVLYVVIFATCFAELPLNRPNWHIRLLLLFHGIPMFFCQLLLCRLAKLRWRLLCPLLPLVIVGILFLAFVRWEPMGWLLFFLWCVAPIFGCILAWAVWALGRLFKRGAPPAAHLL